MAIVAGGVVLRAASTPSGPAVELPVPSPPGDGPANGNPGADVGAGADAGPVQAPDAAYGPGAAQGSGAATDLSPDGGESGAADEDDAVTGRPDVPGPGAEDVVVHVVGEVASPGVVRLPAGARVADAVQAAGGATAEADTSAVNLARLVVDGEQIVVPVPGAAPPTVPVPGTAAGTAGGGTAASDGPVDLNTADLAALDGLPGVGPVLAERILERRTRRPFRSVDELMDVSGIGPAVMERLRERVRV